MRLLLILSSLLFLIFTKSVFADVPIKEFQEAQCLLNESMVTCDNGFRWGGYKTDECQNYRLNPAYKRLVVQTNYGPVDSDHAEEKYCLRSGSLFELTTYHILAAGRLLLITVLIELPLFWLFKFRGARLTITILIANIISVPALYLISLALPYRNFYILVFLELMVILFESSLIRGYNQQFSFRNIFIFTFFINVVSASLGGLINSSF